MHQHVLVLLLGNQEQTLTDHLISKPFPRGVILKAVFIFLDGQCSFWQDTIQDEPRPDLVEAFSNKVTSAWQNRQEIFLQAIDCQQELFDQPTFSMTLVSSVLQVHLCFCLQFSTSQHYRSHSPIDFVLPHLEQSTSPTQSRNLGC